MKCYKCGYKTKKGEVLPTITFTTDKGYEEKPICHDCGGGV